MKPEMTHEDCDELKGAIGLENDRLEEYKNNESI